MPCWCCWVAVLVQKKIGRGTTTGVVVNIKKGQEIETRSLVRLGSSACKQTVTIQLVSEVEDAMRGEGRRRTYLPAVHSIEETSNYQQDSQWGCIMPGMTIWGAPVGCRWRKPSSVSEVLQSSPPSVAASRLARLPQKLTTR